MDERTAPKASQRAGVTQEDVARVAGVSTASVSRVLNDSPLVRPQVRERVERAVEALGYVPNSAARALALNRTHTIGAVIPTLGNAIFAEGVDAFEEALRSRGYTLLVSISNYDGEAEATLVRRMVERGVDGVMLVGTDHAAATLATLRRTATPFVCTWSHAPERGLPTVGFDNRAAMDAVVDHLFVLGHRTIAMLAGIAEGNDRARDRIEGVRTALARRGLALPDRRLVEVPYTVDAARHAAARLLGGKASPSALICGNDVIAYGVLFAAGAKNIDVPRQLSVVGFDDLALSRHVPPGLTTVRVPTAAMGEAAATRLVDIVEGKAAEEAGSGGIRLDTRLCVRASTAPPPKSA